MSTESSSPSDVADVDAGGWLPAGDGSTTSFLRLSATLNKPTPMGTVSSSIPSCT